MNKPKYKIGKRVAFNKDQFCFVIDGFFCGTITNSMKDAKTEKPVYFIKKEYPEQEEYTSIVREENILTLREARKEIRKHNRMLRKMY